MRNKPKVVVDTNIFISGWFNPINDSYIKIIDLIDDRKIQLLFAQDTIGELIYVAKNFARHNFKDINKRILILEHVANLFYHSMSINTQYTKSPKIKDKYDDIFMKCAIAGEADYLVSDDFNSGMHNIEGFGFKVVGAKDFCRLMKVESCVGVVG